MDDDTNVFIIILIYLILFIVNIYIKLIIAIKNDWDEYKCHPLALPFAGLFNQDPEKNFEECLSKKKKEVVEEEMTDLWGEADALSGEMFQVSEQSQDASTRTANTNDVAFGGGTPDPSSMGQGGDDEDSEDNEGILQQVQNITNNFAELFLKYSLVGEGVMGQLSATMVAIIQFMAGAGIAGESIAKSPVMAPIKWLSQIT